MPQIEMVRRTEYEPLRLREVLRPRTKPRRELRLEPARGIDPEWIGLSQPDIQSLYAFHH